MPMELKPPPYALDALEPHMSQKTMECVTAMLKTALKAPSTKKCACVTTLHAIVVAWLKPTLHVLPR